MRAYCRGRRGSVLGCAILGLIAAECAGPTRAALLEVRRTRVTPAVDLTSVAASTNDAIAVGPAGNAYRREDAGNWIPIPACTDQDLAAVAWADSCYIAVGRAGVILAYDGGHWVPAASGTDADLTSVAAGLGRWVAVGGAGTTLTSTNGLVWGFAESGVVADLTSVCFGRDRFIAVGDGVQLASFDGGASWQAETNGLDMRGVYFAGGRFFRTWLEPTPHVLASHLDWSADGSSWTMDSVTDDSTPILGLCAGNLYVAAVAPFVPTIWPPPEMRLIQYVMYSPDVAPWSLGSVDWTSTQSTPPIGFTAMCFLKDRFLGVAHGGLVVELAEERVVCDLVNIRAMPEFPPQTGTGYFVSTAVVRGVTEHRLFLHGHHFLTVLDAGGAFAIRPHAGVDLNGWGSTLYLMPFLPGAVLTHSTVHTPEIGSGEVVVTATGRVSMGASETMGDWDVALHFAYDPAAKRIAGSGTYHVRLAERLSDSSGDLNLGKIASNYLTDVWRTDGAVGDTGDMSAVAVSATGIPAFQWVPSTATPGHFPTDESADISIRVSGQFNQVDTVLQSGVPPIQAAYKPTIELSLISQAPMDRGIRFGVLYTVDEAQNYTADNIGITPLVFRTSTQTNYTFSVTFSSWPIENDGRGVEADVHATAMNGVLDAIGISYTDNLGLVFPRWVGTIPRTDSVRYAGTIRIPFANVAVPPATGFVCWDNASW